MDSIGNYVQYFIITYTGKEYENICICMYNLNHFSVHQNPTQHCKLIILQFKKTHMSFSIYLFNRNLLNTPPVPGTVLSNSKTLFRLSEKLLSRRKRESS